MEINAGRTWIAGRQGRRASVWLAAALLVWLACAAGLPRPAALGATSGGTGGPAIAPDIRFGAVEALQAPTRATQAGVRWERLPFHWNTIQPNGPLDWQDPYPTRTLTDEASRGRAIAGVIDATPGWAATDPSQGSIAVPRGLNTPYNDAANSWGTFTGRLAQRYRGLVKTWFILSEPDRNAATVHHTWAGSVADYYLLLKTAYLAIKASDPQAQVVVGGLTYWWDKENNRPQFLESLLQQADADPTARAHGGYFDGVGAHVYNNPLNSYTVPLVFGRILAKYGYYKAIWIDETNVAPYDDPAATLPSTPFRTTMAGQAAYLVESYALALAAGVRRIEVYRMVDEPTGADLPDHFGLLRQDGSPRPAFAAYQTVTSVFGGTTSAYFTWHDDGSAPAAGEIDSLLASVQTHVEWAWPGPVARVVLRDGDRQVTVLWATTPASVAVSLPVSGQNAVLIDDQGGRSTPNAGADGRYHLTLAGATDNSDPRDRGLYLVGGPPLILQETGVTTAATPPVTETTTASTDLTTTPTLTATGTVTVTPVATATAALTATAMGVAITSTPPTVEATPTATSLSAGATQGAAPVPPLPAAAHALYFPQTGHNVAGAFRTIFTLDGGVAVFGYPRTEAYKASGLLVQYFQNLALQCPRLCRDPAYTATTTLMPLGSAAAADLPPAPRLDTWADSLYFASTSHNLTGPFLDYWQAHDGATILGPPVSEQVDEVAQSGTPQAYTVQYFQNGELAYRPTGVGGQFAVVLATLGDEVLRQRGWLP